MRLAAQGGGYLVAAQRRSALHPGQGLAPRLFRRMPRRRGSRRSPRCPTNCWPSIAPLPGSSAPAMAIRRGPAGTRPRPCSRPPTAPRWPGCSRSPRGFVALMEEAGVPVRFQIGEPWWWIMADGRPCLYDDAAKAAFGGNPVAIADMRAALSAAQKALLDQAGALLASSTAALRDAVRAAAAPASCRSAAADLPARPCSTRPCPKPAAPTCRPAGPARPSTGCRSKTTTG